MSFRTFCCQCLCLFAVFASAFICFADSSSAQGQFIAKGGKAEAVIVVGQQSRPFDRWVAGELQRYLQRLSGAEFAVVTSDKVPADKTLILVGGPAGNPLIASAQQKQLVNFAGLKPDGFVLKSIDLSGRPALVAGAGDEAGTMYAVYDLLERLGIVFQLTNDIIPQQKPDLPLPKLDVRIEPVLKYRGMHCCHGLRWYMGLDDFRKHIDQLAKLKLNCLEFYFGMGSPWLQFSHAGKAAEIMYPKESGYVAWGPYNRTSGTAKDVRVGRECFPRERICAPEFAGVQTQEEAYRTARAFLREVILYAHQRKVQVWLIMGEVPYVPPNLVPPGVKALHSMYCGQAIPIGEPALLEIWNAAVDSLIQTYPEADAYGLWTSEIPVSSSGDAQSKKLIDEYAASRKLISSPEEIQRRGNAHLMSQKKLASDFAQVCVVDKLVQGIKKRHPEANFGVCLLFRGYLFRVLDSLLPKDVWLLNMENYRNTAPVMHFYGDVSGRELLAMPRVDDDGCELHMQLNAMEYDRDEIISGSAKYGLAGFIGQLNKERGLECNARYLADGAWNPTINCRSFYEGYLDRIYGPEALEGLLKAFLILEENDKALGWSDRSGIFQGYMPFSPLARLRMNVNYKEAKPTLDRQQAQGNIQYAEGRRQFWDSRTTHCQAALALLHEARPKVLPGAREELEYVIFKTENFIIYFQVLNACQEATAALDRAWLAKSDGKEDEFRKHLGQCQAALDRADRLARDAARQMIPYANIPTEKYLLFRYNQNVIGSIEVGLKYVAELVAFHKP